MSNTQELVGQNEVFSNMAEGKPLKSYKKVILGKLLIKVWDSMNNAPSEKIFAGDPRRGEEAIFDVFSEKEKVYFERMNRAHFVSGMLTEHKRPEVTAPPVRTYEQFNDEELSTIVNSRFLSLQSSLNKIESVAVLSRMVLIAEDLDKSEKITNAIKSRISELQVAEFAPKKPKLEDSLEEE